MKRIVIDNYIRVWSKRAGVQVISEATSEGAAKKVRESCAEKAKDLETWARLIRANCVVPPDHPFRQLLKSRGVAADDHLWTLGAIAFGTENPWIAIREIEWGKGEVTKPEEEEKAWLDRLAKGTVLAGR
ncbi:MAG: hypothetical protein AAB368_03525 [bacterium]